MKARAQYTMVTMVILLGACIDQPSIVETEPSFSVPANQIGAMERYVVRTENALAAQRALGEAERTGARVRNVFSSALNGFVAEMSSDVAERVRQTPGVRFVVKDVGVFAHNAPAQLDRLDSRPRVLDGLFTRYYSGAGVRVYVLGSGVYLWHAEFGSRVIGGWSVDAGHSAFHDHTGHETGVASVAAGTYLGSAPGASIFSVKFDFPGGPPFGDAWLGDMISAVDWVRTNHVKPAVALMSWGVPNWVDNILVGSLDDAVKNAIAAGIMFVTSAGNSSENACSHVPARVLQGLTVAATEAASDAHASFSNHGPCVDIYAPGVAIPMATPNGGYTTANGTSFAAPYVAGVVAQLLQQNPGITPPYIQMVIKGSATTNIVQSTPPLTENRFIYSIFSHAIIEGPSGMYSPGLYTWQVRTWGGTGQTATYTYVWHRSDNGGVTWNLVGTEQSYEAYLAEGECDNFVLRATVNNGVEVRQPILVVTPRIELCPI